MTDAEELQQYRNLIELDTLKTLMEANGCGRLILLPPDAVGYASLVGIKEGEKGIKVGGGAGKFEDIIVVLGMLFNYVSQRGEIPFDSLVQLIASTGPVKAKFRPVREVDAKNPETKENTSNEQ